MSDIGEIGDADGDGVINVLDITRIIRIILELDISTPGADLLPRWGNKHTRYYLYSQ